MEIEIAQRLAQHLRSQLPEKGFRLLGIEVLLGKMVELEEEALMAALQVELPTIEVKIQRIEGLMRCIDCGAQYPNEEHPCPVCGSPHAELIAGMELEIGRAWGESVSA